MKFIKRIVSILLVAIGIPFLVYRLIVNSTKWIFHIYCYIHSVNISTLTESGVYNILLSTTYLASVLGEFLGIIVLILLFIPTGQSLYKRCNFKKFSMKKLPVIFFIIVGFNFIAITFIYYMESLTTSYNGAQAAMHSSWFSPFELIGTILLVPIFEEIIFRGAVFSVLKNNLNIYVAVILQGVVFAYMHSMGGGMVQASYTFILGLLLLLASYYANSMFGDIFAHIIFNLFGLIILPILQAIYFSVPLYLGIGALFIIIGLILYKKEMKGQKFRIT